MPPTPPPDIDLDAWTGSLERIRHWGPEALFVAHFGPHTSAEAHLAELADHLALAGRLSKASLERQDTADDEAREAWFADAMRRELQGRAPSEAAAYELAAPYALSWRGLARYWRKGAR
jgi:hypothetical protein